MLAKESVKVSLLCPFPRVLWLFRIGLVLYNGWETQHTWPPPGTPPLLPAPALARELSRAISSQASASPHSLKCTILVQEGED